MSSALRLLVASALLAACHRTESLPRADAALPATSAASAAPPPMPAMPAGPWNVLLVSIDSMRADMPWAGYDRPIAPRLSALEARSIVFGRAYATSSFTSKSVAGLLTGRYPSSLARTGSFFTQYLKKDDFLCTTLAAANVPCIGGHAHAYFGKGQAGFDHGFADWRIVPGITFDYQTDPYVTSDKLTPLAIEMLGAVPKDRPFFAWFHYMDPHDEYKTHTESPHFGTRARDLYDEEIFFTDLHVGKLLDFVDAQPWAARTVVVVTADHGEAFGEHGMTRHAHELWEELVHVPLFFHIPGLPPRSVDTPRSHIDLAPTFAELLGVKVDGLPGTSLVPELTNPKSPTAEAAPRDVVVDLPEDDYNERRRALVHGTTKIIAFGDDARFALFDLAADPKEQDDLVRKNPAVFTEMRERYRQASRAIHDVAPTGGIPQHKERR